MSRGIREEENRNGDEELCTLIVGLLIPIRVAGDVLGLLLLLMLLAAAALEHLLEELELGGCECEERKEADVKRNRM